MLFNHTPTGLSHTFDDERLIADTGLIPLVKLAQDTGLPTAVADRVHIPTDKGANPGTKVMSLVAGMLAGADSIDDMNRNRTGGMKHLATSVYAPSTLGQFLRKFTFGHVRALQTACDQALQNLARRVDFFPTRTNTANPADQMVFVDIDDTVIAVHSARKQGSGHGYTGVRGLNGLLAVASTTSAQPVIIGNRLRKGAVHSARGAKKFTQDALSAVGRLPGVAGKRVVLAADSAYYNSDIANAAITAGADITVTACMNPSITKAITGIDESAWAGIQYPQAIWDEDNQEWISEAEVAETGYTAFTTTNSPVTGRLVIRRIPEKNQKKLAKAGQEGLFTVWRYHAVFTTIPTDVLNTVQADEAHRRHAVIEQVNAELKAGPIAHMPAGAFNANAAWLALACMTHNLARTGALLAGGRLSKSRAPTLRARQISIPARIACHARRIVCHLPTHWPHAYEFHRLWSTVFSPPAPAMT